MSFGIFSGTTSKGFGAACAAGCCACARTEKANARANVAVARMRQPPTAREIRVTKLFDMGTPCYRARSVTVAINAKGLDQKCGGETIEGRRRRDRRTSPAAGEFGRAGFQLRGFRDHDVAGVTL